MPACCGRAGPASAGRNPTLNLRFANTPVPRQRNRLISYPGSAEVDDARQQYTAPPGQANRTLGAGKPRWFIRFIAGRLACKTWLACPRLPPEILRTAAFTP